MPYTKMKFLWICFATSVSIASLVILDTVEAQVKRYANFDDFLAELKTSAGSWLDYVTTMQALFCPNQPVCGADGELKRKDVLSTLPAVLSVGNFTVKPEDIAQSVGVCCLSCSCTDSCRQDDNCCPTKQMLPDTSNETAVVKAECIVASARSYSDKTGGEPYHRNHQYHMITNCFHDNTNDTLVARCQRPDTHALADRVPVTSQLTGYTYWNKPCAVCNDDAEDLMEWTPVVLIKTMIPYFSKSLIRIPYPDTYELLFQLLSAQRFADVIYTRPASISANDQECIREDSLGANQVVCSNTLSEEDWLSEPCNQLYSPVRDRTAYNFRNIFCWACRTSIQMNVNNPSCSVKEGFKANPGYLTALLNYKSEPETTALHEVKRLVGEGNCDCAMMYDPYLRRCRPLFCPAGEIRAGCQCIQPLRNLTGMSVVLMAKVTSRSEESNSLTSGQLQKLHAALEEALETTAVNTTIHIATTLKQENATSLTYLCIATAKSNPGLDTKRSMRPFLKYLDTDEVLELKVGKLGFKAALTTQAKIWIVGDTYSDSFKACCLEQKSNELVQIYVNKLAMKLIYRITGQSVYQPMSRLLFCNQLQLDNAEYIIMNTGIVKVNVTDPMISISDYYPVSIADYYPVSQSGIRICADTYVQRARGKEAKSAGAVCTMSILFITILVTGAVAFVGHLNL